MAWQTILMDTHDGVASLTLNRPQRRNAFNDQQYDDLRDALAEAQADDEVRVALITGAPGAFSAGQDISEMGQAPASDGRPHGFVPFVDRLASFDKPLLAAVNGVAVGIGVTMLFHCDIVYLAASARLRMPFAALGIVPEAGSTFLLPLLLGQQRAAELLFTARWMEATEAVELGLGARVFPDQDLLPAALATAAEIAAQAPQALRHAKRLLLACRAEALALARAREDAVQARCMNSPENREAILAFREKRRPDFKRIGLR